MAHFRGSTLIGGVKPPAFKAFRHTEAPMFSDRRGLAPSPRRFKRLNRQHALRRIIIILINISKDIH
jgi:hypothetical protein